MAQPAPGWLIAGWSGTVNDGSHAPANRLTMPATPAGVSVTFRRGVWLPTVLR